MVWTVKDKWAVRTLVRLNNLIAWIIVSAYAMSQRTPCVHMQDTNLGLSPSDCMEPFHTTNWGQYSIGTIEMGRGWIVSLHNQRQHLPA